MKCKTEFKKWIPLVTLLAVAVPQKTFAVGSRVNPDAPDSAATTRGYSDSSSSESAPQTPRRIFPDVDLMPSHSERPSSSSSSEQVSSSDDASSTRANHRKKAHKEETSSDGEAHDLSVNELEKSIFNFKADVSGEDPSTTITLRGKVFKACADHLSISNNASAKDAVGFTVTDDGDFLSCVHRMKDDGLKCSTNPKKPNYCVSVSSLDNAKLETGSMKDVKIGLLREDANVDSDDLTFEDFDSNNPIAHVSKSTLAKQRAEKIRQAREDKIEQLRSDVKNCRRNMDELATAKSSLELLAKMVRLDSTEFDSMNKSIINSELNILKKRIAKVNTLKEDAVDQLSSDIEDFAEENPDRSDDAAKLLYMLAQKMNRPDATSEDFDKAKDIIGQAQDLPDLSETQANKLAGYQTQLDVGKLSMQATTGQLDSFTFMPQYTTLMTHLSTDVMQSCRISSNSGGLPDSCTQARRNWSTASQIPAQVQQTQYQQAQLQLQLQQQLTSAMIPQPTNSQIPAFQNTATMRNGF